MQKIISGPFGDFKSVFKAEQIAETSIGWKDLKRITSSAYMKSSEDREILYKLEIKILKSKGPRMESWRTLKENGTNREKGLYMRTCCVQFVRNEQINKRGKTA